MGAVTLTRRHVLLLWAIAAWNVVTYANFAKNLWSAHEAGEDRPAGYWVAHTVLIVVDLILLVAMVGRIGAFGASANKVAALGLNIVVLGNLVGSAWLGGRFVARRGAFAELERWQTAYLPAYGAWALVVVVVVPPVFGYR